MYRIVLDTETAGSVNNEATLRVYDFGFVVLDDDDNIIDSFSWVCRDVFFCKLGMESSYYADKLPQYYEAISNGQHEIKNFADIRDDFIAICNEYNVSQVWAYNAGFDRKALNATTRAISNDLLKTFLPQNIVWCDIMQNAARMICDNKKYYDFALANNFVSKCGNVRTSAEAVYSFLINSNDFAESHTALADAEIEAVILHACRKQKKKMYRDIKNNCWQIPQKGFKEYVKGLI